MLTVSEKAMKKMIPEEMTQEQIDAEVQRVRDVLARNGNQLGNHLGTIGHAAHNSLKKAMQPAKEESDDVTTMAKSDGPLPLLPVEIQKKMQLYAINYKKRHPKAKEKDIKKAVLKKFPYVKIQ